MPLYNHAIVQQPQDVNAAVIADTVKQLVSGATTWATDMEQPVASFHR